MGRIFLSYAREDRAPAGCLARVLEDAGHSVWWDRQIESGEEFSAEIEAELDRAEVVLVAWSAQSVKSRWVRDEAAVGGDTGRLVPVSVDGCRPPMGFRQFQTLDLTGWRGRKSDERTTRLLHAVERRLAEPGKVATPAVARDKIRKPLGRGKWAWSIAAMVALMLVAGSFLYFMMGNSRGVSIKPTIALLPFTSAGADPVLRDVASQARDSLAHTFSQSGVPVKLINSTAGNVPGADFAISGDVSRNGEKIVANVRLDEVAHGTTVYSHSFAAVPADTPSLAERIGAQMAGNLTWGAPLMVLDRREPLDPSLMADLLQTFDFTGDALQWYQNSQRVAAKAPDVAIAQISLAFNTSFVLSQIPRGERADAVSKARDAGDRALKLQPDFGDTYGVWCLLHNEALFSECEDRLRQGRRIDPDAPFLNAFLSQTLRNVGRFDEAVDLTRLSYSHDSYVPTKIGWMLQMLEYVGDHESARNLHLRGVRWWPDFKDYFFRHRLWGLMERGYFESVERLEVEIGPKDLPTNYQSSAPLASAVKFKSPDAAKRACIPIDEQLLMSRCMLALAAAGDLQDAYSIAGKLYPRRAGPTPAETDSIWLDAPDSAPTEFITSPGAAPLRRDPRYMQLAQRTGLLAYWRSGRVPDFCRRNAEPICRQLLARRR